MTTTKYQPQTSKHMEKFTKTFFAWQYDISEQQTKLKLFVRPIAYCYDTQLQSSTQNFPFSFTFSQKTTRVLFREVILTKKVMRINPFQDKLKIVI